MLLGFNLQWCLFGALTVQIAIYSIHFPKDELWIKILVYSIYAAESVQTILLTIQDVKVYGDGFGNMAILIGPSLLWFSILIMSACISFVVQIAYAYRIRPLSKSWVAPCIIIFLAIIQWAGGVATGIFAHQAPDLPHFLSQKTFITLGVWNVGSALCDILIAGFMTYFLSREKTKMKTTQRIVHRLIRLIIETGTVTGKSSHSNDPSRFIRFCISAATLSIINLVLCLLPSRPAYYQLTLGLLAKSYSNSLMVVFNSRIKPDGRYNETDCDETEGRFSAFGVAPNTSFSMTQQSSQVVEPTDQEEGSISGSSLS
ncbi:hypothetical protein D9613_008161 [Agrocybe pediades]|uniref:DUF6534 domain-containing protein n=1 Tax=Agrocybe pediades TaxID=84607 RepID=A0A8H4VKR7_9AGAR|nr:hypothetical protein D9613_008161 [Agrocybe pediades]